MLLPRSLLLNLYSHGKAEGKTGSLNNSTTIVSGKTRGATEIMIIYYLSLEELVFLVASCSRISALSRKTRGEWFASCSRIVRARETREKLIEFRAPP
jgi:hypothetical protein